MRAEKEAEVAILSSKASLMAAGNKAKAMVAKAEAEMKAVDSLAEKRSFDLEWKRLEVRTPLLQLTLHVSAGKDSCLSKSHYLEYR